MNHMTQTAYAQPAAPVRTARAVEYDVIARITQRLAAAIRGQVISRPSIMTWMRRSFAAAFVGLSVKLALTER